MVLTDFRSTLQTLVRVKPDEVYNLAGQSSVGPASVRSIFWRQSAS
jgi:GDP-D-mannose dehydratase